MNSNGVSLSDYEAVYQSIKATQAFTYYRQGEGDFSWLGQLKSLSNIIKHEGISLIPSGIAKNIKVAAPLYYEERRINGWSFVEFFEGNVDRSEAFFDFFRKKTKLVGRINGKVTRESLLDYVKALYQSGEDESKRRVELQFLAKHLISFGISEDNASTKAEKIFEKLIRIASFQLGYAKSSTYIAGINLVEACLQQSTQLIYRMYKSIPGSPLRKEAFYLLKALRLLRHWRPKNSHKQSTSRFFAQDIEKLILSYLAVINRDEYQQQDRTRINQQQLEKIETYAMDKAALKNYSENTAVNKAQYLKTIGFYAPLKKQTISLAVKPVPLGIL